MFTLPITAKTKGGAAKQLYRHLLYICKELDQSTDAVVLRRPGEGDWGPGWEVCWEEGPYEWTMAATGGEDIFAQEYYADGYNGRVATFEFDTSKGVFAEPQNHYALGFYKF